MLAETPAIDRLRNQGLRFSAGSKWTLCEGGIRVPLLVRWPGVTSPGSICARPVTGADLFPTLAAIAGAPVPVDRPLDGESLRPLPIDPSAPFSRDVLTWHFPFHHPPFVDESPVSAIRRGNRSAVP